MKIQYASDIHLELSDNSRFIKSEPFEVTAVVAREHKGSLLNSAFATELGNFIADNHIDAWIFGHSHANEEAIIGNTRLVCNQHIVRISVDSHPGISVITTH